MDRDKVTSEVVAMVACHIASNGDDANVTPSDNLAEKYGLDSLDFVELIIKLEDKYKIRIDDDAVIKAATPRAIADVIAVAKKAAY